MLKARPLKEGAPTLSGPFLSTYHISGPKCTLEQRAKSNPTVAPSTENTVFGIWGQMGDPDDRDLAGS